MLVDSLLVARRSRWMSCCLLSVFDQFWYDLGAVYADV